jgi:hypothetical protein
MNRNTLLLDGDLIAYRIAAALETPVNWGDGLWTLHCYEDECNKAFVHKVESIKAEILTLYTRPTVKQPVGRYA